MVIELTRRCVAPLAAALLFPVAAAAQTDVGLFAGYVGTNGLDNEETAAEAAFKDSAAYSLVLSRALDATREVQLLYSHQSTTLSPGGTTRPFDLIIRHLHLGGTVSIDGTLGRGAYVVGGVGVTYFDPGTSGYGSELRPSLNVGFGYAWPLGQSFALRTEARGFVTLINSSSSFLCSGGCVVALSGDAIWQGELKIGLSARF